MFSYSMFFGDDVMLTQECFPGGRYNNNSEIGTSKFFSGTCGKNWTVV